ncbi:hypothetical protein IMZ11_03980 [Microtetraspora sp. AC03309]|uniref:AMP-binding enzyme n=1 Tax=Microtetraspora sp. AC03309 TaxID=2779376 RepID=UPI0027E07DE6|nr:hypothetical protein [Microtetraspora sp. AC03309]MCC5574794.1 hypothetical protein [Microtetraspora sp. AC03309]
MRIVDRKKDLIITGGVNVYPRDVEIAIDECPGVMESAVIGEHDETWGERVVAYVVGETTADEIEARLRPRLTGYKIPKTIRFVPRLPRNSAGKVLKRELRKDV